MVRDTTKIVPDNSLHELNVRGPLALCHMLNLPHFHDLHPKHHLSAAAQLQHST